MGNVKNNISAGAKNARYARRTKFSSMKMKTNKSVDSFEANSSIYQINDMSCQTSLELLEPLGCIFTFIYFSQFSSLLIYNFLYLLGFFELKYFEIFIFPFKYFIFLYYFNYKIFNKLKTNNALNCQST